jgi:Zn-dependent protease
VLVATLLLRLGLGAGMFDVGSRSIAHLVQAAAPGWESVAFVLSVLFTMNLILFVLNIMPVPPLEGSGVLPSSWPRLHPCRRSSPSPWSP